MILQQNEDKKCDIEDIDAAGVGCGHPVLDVPR